MSNITLRRAILLALAPTAVVATAHAQEAAMPSIELDPIVVTVGRNPNSLSNTPATVSVISSREIQKNPTQNLSDVLQKDAGISVKQYGGVGQAPEISLRGTNSAHTLVLKDGARLNSQNNFMPTTTGFYDLSDIERVEIAKGPASVQYGSDAIGGVVQMLTATPVQNRVFVTGVAGEHSTYKAITGIDVAHNGAYVQLRGQRLETDGTRIFNTQNRDTSAGYEQKGYSAKIGFNNDKNIDTSVSFGYNEGTNEYSSDGKNINAARLFENQTLNAKAQFKPVENLEVGVRYSQIKDKQFVDEPNIESWQTDNNYDTKAQEIDLHGKWSFSPTQNILIGATGNHSEFESNKIKDEKQEVDTIGYYVQHQYNSDKLNTQVGVRVEDNERFGTHTVGQGSARFHFTPNTSVYTNIGSAFRAPSLNEMYTIWGGNPELKPEESISYEVGITQNFGGNLTANLSGYHTEIKNLIANPTNNKNINIEKAKISGGELTLKYARGDYYAAAGYAYTEAKNKETGMPLAYRPKHKGSLTIGYDDSTVGVSTTVNANSHTFDVNTRNIATRMAGYATIDIDTYWQISPYAKLFANIKNLTNVEHKVAFDEYNNRQWYINGGREANIGLTFSYQ